RGRGDAVESGRYIFVVLLQVDAGAHGVQLAALERAGEADHGRVSQIDDPRVREVDDAQAFLAQLGLDGIELGAHLAVARNRKDGKPALRQGPEKGLLLVRIVAQVPVGDQCLGTAPFQLGDELADEGDVLLVRILEASQHADLQLTRRGPKLLARAGSIEGRRAGRVAAQRRHLPSRTRRRRRRNRRRRFLAASHQREHDQPRDSGAHPRAVSALYGFRSMKVFGFQAVWGGRARPKREPTAAPRAKNCNSARMETPSQGTKATRSSTAIPIPSAAGATNRWPGPAGRDSPIRRANEDSPIT